MNSKPELRRMFRDLLKGETNAASVALLCDRLVQHFQKEIPDGGPRQATWAAYQPTGFEADIRHALAAIADVDWVFPRVMENGTMKFFRPHAPSNFILNKWGILEPDPAHSEKVELSEIDGLLIPALAFDLQLNRLGRGKGFYDRALAELSLINPHVTKIGVALDLQISTSPFPAESFDIPMNLVITESRTLRSNSGASQGRPTERKSS